MILSAIVALFSIGIIASLITHMYFDEHLIHKSFIAMFFLLFGPLLYLYVKAMTGQKTRYALFHFFPYIFSFICISLFSVFFLEKDEFIIHVVLSIILTIQISYYLTVTVISFRSYSQSIRDNFSSVEKIDLSWLRFLIGCFFAAWGAAFVIEFIASGEHRWDYFWLFLSAIIYSIGYIGLTRPSAFTSVPGNFKNAVIEDDVDEVESNVIESVKTRIENKKYLKTSLSSEKIDIISEQLEKYVASENPFLDPEISMPVLAGELGIAPHHLSQVINNKFKMNFFEYINRMRIEFARNAIVQTNDSDINITRIAFDSGFNSISPFNTAFKKFIGMTPSEYKDSVKK